MDDWRKPNSIHQIPLQLLSTGLIGTLNQIDQFENEHIRWNESVTIRGGGGTDVLILDVYRIKQHLGWKSHGILGNL